MDSKSGIEKLQEDFNTPKDFMQDKMNIIMAHQHISSSLEYSVQLRWVRGHADQKEEDNSKITPMEAENIECDEEAEECIQRNIVPHQWAPMDGFRAMLRLNNKWITSNLRKHVCYANTAPDLREYGCKRLKISSAVYDTINWKAIGKVRSTHRINKIVRISKMLFGWMPVGHNWLKCSLQSLSVLKH